MSRCIPFPPPGYAKNGVSGDALIELIELKRIKHEEKLEKKREKKKRKEFDKGIVEEKLSKDGIENGENSDVTAEYEQATVPAGRSISSSSDETQSGTSMRERQLSCHDDDDDASKKGRIIPRPLQKHKESETATVDDRSCSTSGGMSSLEQKKQNNCEFNAADKSCSTSGWICSSEQQKCEVRQPVGLETSAIAKDHNSTSIAEQPSTSAREAKSGRSASSIVQSSKLLPFEFLMDKSTLLPFEALLPADEGTKDWLFRSVDQRDRHQSKRLKMTQDEKANACPTVWSHAHCLPEPGTYALPYTVIF